MNSLIYMDLFCTWLQFARACLEIRTNFIVLKTSSEIDTPISTTVAKLSRKAIIGQKNFRIKTTWEENLVPTSSGFTEGDKLYKHVTQLHNKTTLSKLLEMTAPSNLQRVHNLVTLGHHPWNIPTNTCRA